MIKVLFAPSIPWRIETHAKDDFSRPNPRLLYDLLREDGIDSSFYDPLRSPWNPFSGKDTLLQSLDPLRALDIVLRKRDIDIVVSVFEGAAASIGSLRTLTRYRPALALWDIGLTNWRLRNKIIAHTLPRIDKAYVLGRNQISYIRETYGSNTEISNIGHSVDTDFFHATPIDMLGTVLSVGDDIGRDFPTLIEATREVSKKVIIKSSKFIPTDALPDNVHLMKERISYLALRKLYAESRIVVIPSQVTNNASGVSSILEAASSGRPLIVSNNPGIYDFIVPNETCLVVPPGNPIALREAIQRLLSDDQECKRLANNARDFAVQYCSVKTFAKRFGSELRNLALSRKAFPLAQP